MKYSGECLEVVNAFVYLSSRTLPMDSFISILKHFYRYGMQIMPLESSKESMSGQQLRRKEEGLYLLCMGIGRFALFSRKFDELLQASWKTFECFLKKKKGKYTM